MHNKIINHNNSAYLDLQIRGLEILTVDLYHQELIRGLDSNIDDDDDDDDDDEMN